jgi:hypothetical protein
MVCNLPESYKKKSGFIVDLDTICDFNQGMIHKLTSEQTNNKQIANEKNRNGKKY